MPTQTDPILLVVDDLPSGSTGKDLWDNGQLIRAEVWTTYTQNTGRVVVPKAGADGTAPLVCKMHAAIWYKTVEFKLWRAGSPIKCPDWETDDANFVLLASDFTPHAPTPYDGRLKIHHVTGFYKYVMLSPPVKADGDFKAMWCIYFENAKATYFEEMFSKEYQDWEN